jgi:hypothetical protein
MLNQKRMPSTVVIEIGELSFEIEYIKHNYTERYWTAKTTQAGATGKNRSHGRITPAAQP